ncbi:threonine aldolase family protein [Erythrobacter sp.]|uniref:threonine aldolase family protein n=1 Tax=Erythrobacter sp. TaxID=1042 RepID=UPI003C758B99
MTDHSSRPRPFLSDNAAPVHPRVWEAMRNADLADSPYDGDALSAQLDERFSDLFGRECAGLWVATGTAANCLALATMVQPHGGVVCHEEAHIEVDEGGAPGFFLHGAKLVLCGDAHGGEGGKLTPEQVAARIDPIRDDVHQVQPHAIAITQASEYGRVYRPGELERLADFAKVRGLGLHMDGARFANAAAFLGGSATQAAGAAARGVDSLAFGCIKNGAMSAEAIVLFDPEQADLVKYRRKRAGHLQCKGRYLAAQVLAMLDADLWLENARHANVAAQEIASGCGERLMHPVEANELFVTMSANEREALRAQDFAFYDWGADAARFVTAWDTRENDARALGKAIAAL